MVVVVQTLEEAEEVQTLEEVVRKERLSDARTMENGIRDGLRDKAGVGGGEMRWDEMGTHSCFVCRNVCD